MKASPEETARWKASMKALGAAVDNAALAKNVLEGRLLLSKVYFALHDADTVNQDIDNANRLRALRERAA